MNEQSKRFPGERSDEQMVLRDAKADEVRRAFENAQVGVIHQRMTAMPYSSIIAYINYGYHGQRQAVILFSDDGVCNVYLSPIYDVPAGKTGDDMDLGQLPLLFSLPLAMPNLGEEVVRRVRTQIVENSDEVMAKPREDPIPLTSLKTLGDLIDAHEEYFTKSHYSVLISELRKHGKVRYRGRVWSLTLGMISHWDANADEISLPEASGIPIDFGSISDLDP